MTTTMDIGLERRLRLEAAYRALLRACTCHPRESREADIISAMLDTMEIELVDRDHLLPEGSLMAPPALM